MAKLHLGCGRDILPGWLNVDSRPGPGVDLVADLDDLAARPLPLPDDSVEEFLASHLLEHLRQPLAFMQELHRVAKPDAVAAFRLPYGSSDAAWEDPTHVRPYFVGSFAYFGQPAYARADYGYRGDWHTEKIRLLVEHERFAHMSAVQVFDQVMGLRNVVLEMRVLCRAVKPARPPQAGNAAPPEVQIVLHGRGGVEEVLR